VSNCNKVFYTYNVEAYEYHIIGLSWVIRHSCKTPNHFLSFKGKYLWLFAYRIGKYTVYLEGNIQEKIWQTS
jgi:hypothetical protein